MNAKKLLAGLVALALCGSAYAITSEEIAEVLGVSPDIATFSLGGVSEWSIDTNTFHSGSSSLKSGFINNSSSTWQASEVVMTINVKEACKLTYWFKQSCYNSTDGEKLSFIIDGSTYTGTGIYEWTLSRAHVLLPGQHNIRFSYERRYNWTTSGASYCVWIDEITLTPICPVTSNVEVTDIQCQQRYPWNGMVDIDYTLKSDDSNAEIWVYPIGYDKDSNKSMAPRALTGDGAGASVGPGAHRMTWSVTDDYPEFHSTAFTVRMIALTGAAPYMVVDLSGGVDALSYPVSYLSSVPEGGWSDEYKTTKLVLRLIPPGSFMMGSPSDETGRSSYEDLHGVVLTKPFYLGVFEVTQKQYELVMGENPSDPAPTADSLSWSPKCPVNKVSYNNIRGSVNGAGWPTHNQVDANSFMGRLRSKINMLFDLPTEAQWEYACRAGTSTALNSGKNLTATGTCTNMAEVGRYSNNRGSNTGKAGWYNYQVCVGQYLPNAWGLYDMHGNVCEWCRDFHGGSSSLGTAGVIDPKGTSSGSYRVFRGGGYGSSASYCRSAFRYSNYTGYAYASSSSASSDVGFRVMCSPVAE